VIPEITIRRERDQMKRTSIFTLLCLLVIAYASAATADAENSGKRWISFAEADEGSQPKIMVLDSDQQHTIVDIELPGFWTTDKNEAGESFQELTIPGQTTLMNIGKPALPVIRFLVAVPIRAKVEFSCQADRPVALDGYSVYPYQPPLTDTDTKSRNFTIDRTAYVSADPYPASTAIVSAPSTWRHIEVVQVELSPMEYIADQQRLVTNTHLVVELRYSPVGAVDALDATIGMVNSHWDRMYRRHVVNYNWLEDRQDLLRSEGPVYLIITHPNFEGEIQPLAEWHHREGMETEVISIATSSYQTIKNEITDRYEQGNLEYVLLVGDVDYIPANNWGGSASDYWYACITGSPDNFADIAVGRLAVRYSYQAENQVAKILAYEKAPPLDDWLTEIILVAHKEDAPGKYVECKEYIRTDIIPQPPFSIETAYGHQPDGVNATVTEVINNGCNIVNYRGHGDIQEWWAWDYNDDSWFNTQVALLTNGERTPIVFNIACYCHDIEVSCLGEAFLNKYPGGAVASLGASNPSYTTANHSYDKELFRQFTMYDEFRIAWMSNAAATYIINHHGSSGIDNARMYLWLGDPATEVWTGIPGELLVDHPLDIQTGEQTVEITVSSGGNPMENATVCLYMPDDIYEVGTTNVDGIASFTISPSSGGTIYVTVSLHDFLPYEGEIPVNVPNMALTLTPDAGSFPRGTEMGYTVQVLNNEDTPQMLDYWAEVYLPNGNPFQGNPVFGPVTVTIPAGASPSVHLTHFIPPGTPMLSYTYKGCIGIYDITVWQESSFEFLITE
jgi:hypothetical protein